MRLSAAVRKAHRVSSQELSSHFPTTTILKDVTYTIKYARASEFNDSERNLLFEITEANMKNMAQTSSMGWDTEDKRSELFHADSRFIVVYREPDGEDEKIQNELLGFAMFRFDFEQGENIIYCYELQLTAASRRTGIGRFLIDSLVRIGKKYRMCCIKLTALKVINDVPVNVAAMGFYSAMEFELDFTSPDYVDEEDEEDEPEECDYQILRRDIK